MKKMLQKHHHKKAAEGYHPNIDGITVFLFYKKKNNNQYIRRK